MKYRLYSGIYSDEEILRKEKYVLVFKDTVYLLSSMSIKDCVAKYEYLKAAAADYNLPYEVSSWLNDCMEKIAADFFSNVKAVKKRINKIKKAFERELDAELAQTRGDNTNG